MTGPRFTVTDLGDLIAETDDPQLRGVRWWWTPDTGQIEYGLAADRPASSINVWDYAQGRCGIEPTADALAAQRRVMGDRERDTHGDPTPDPEVTSPQGLKKRAPQSDDIVGTAFKVSGKTVRRAQRIRQEAPDLEEKIKRNEITVGEADSEIRKRKAKERFIAAHADWDAKANTKGERWQMLHGDFREALNDIEPGSVDAIVTDPPYPDEFLPLWRDLAEVAVRLLRPGAPLITWSGQLRLPQVLDGLCGPLTYQWIVCLDLPGINSRVPLTKMIQTWKPIIIATNGKWAVPTWQQDRVVSPAKEQALYEWQQNTQPAVEMIERYVSPGGLVLDPFCGVGSFGVAALQTGRRFLGVELDEGRYSQATQRISESLQ